MRRWWLPLVLVLLGWLAAACSDGGTSRATATPAVQVEIGTNAQIEDVAYVAAERVGIDRLPRARLEAAGEARLEAQVRRVPAYRLKDSPKAALRYTADGSHGWVAWQPLAVLYARRELARRENTPAGNIQTVDVTHETWPDGCLGAAQPGQLCSQATVPGFRVLLKLAGRTYEMRTDVSERVVVVP